MTLTVSSRTRASTRMHPTLTDQLTLQWGGDCEAAETAAVVVGAYVLQYWPWIRNGCWCGLGRLARTLRMHAGAHHPVVAAKWTWVVTEWA